MGGFVIPRKDGGKLPPSIQQLSKLSQLQYELVSKGRYIKRLETENKLMRELAIFGNLFGTVLYLCLTMGCGSVIIALSLKSFKVLKR